MGIYELWIWEEKYKRINWFKSTKILAYTENVNHTPIQCKERANKCYKLRVWIKDANAFLKNPK